MIGLNLKIHAVDVQLGVIKPAVYLRAEQGWTVAHLKEAIAEVLLLCICTVDSTYTYIRQRFRLLFFLHVLLQTHEEHLGQPALTCTIFYEIPCI